VRIIVLAANKYSERALATIVALCEAGHAPVGCLCVSTTNAFNLTRKAAEYGTGNFLRYAVKRVVLLGNGSPSGTTTENSESEARVGRERAGLSNVQKACRYYDIKLHYANDVNDNRALSFLQEHRPALIVYTGGGILRRRLLEIPTLGVINAHSGVLPKYRGMNVTEWALLNGDRTGITVHFIDSGIDTGRILFSRLVPITIEDGSLDMLRHRIACATVAALVDAVKMLASGNAEFTNQDPAAGKQYFVMHEKLLEVVERRFARMVSAIGV
jgi:folate-dependent phosphoribosylglycinamide formyltransferase PurN